MIRLQSKSNGKFLQVFENGAVDCTGTQGSICMCCVWGMCVLSVVYEGYTPG